MRPPDDLSTLKHLPPAMLLVGILVVPLMWGFVLEPGSVMALAPFSGLLFLAAGLYIKYRATYSPREVLFFVPLALLFFGSLLVAATTGVMWRMERPDLQWLAVACGLVLAFGSTAAGYVLERRKLHLTHDTVPDALAPFVDLQQHRVRPTPARGAQPAVGVVAFVAATGLNLPLLLQLGGWDRAAVVWLVLPLLGGAVSYILATGIGPGLARAVALHALEARTGQRFSTSRIEELRALRRTFRLSRWFCRPDDLTTSAPSPARPRPAAPRSRRGPSSRRRRSPPTRHAGSCGSLAARGLPFAL